MDDLERVEISAYRTFFESTPAAVARKLGLASVDVAGGIAISTTAMPESRLFNRLLGVEDIAAVVELEPWYRARGCAFAVTVVQGSTLEAHLRERGYTRGRSAMKFRRNVRSAPEAPSSLEVRAIDVARASAFGQLVAAVYRMPPDVAPWFASMHRAPGWQCFGAHDADRLVGVAALHVAGDLGWLGIAATDEAARGRGAQSALLATRIRTAAASGAATLAVETPEPVDGEAPGASHRNLVRAGFEPAYRQQLWLPPGPGGSTA